MTSYVVPLATSAATINDAGAEVDSLTAFRRASPMSAVSRSSRRPKNPTQTNALTLSKAPRNSGRPFGRRSG